MDEVFLKLERERVEGSAGKTLAGESLPTQPCVGDRMLYRMAHDARPDR